MKTNYRPRSSPPPWSKRLFYVGVVFALAFTVLFFARGAVFELISPIWKGSNAFTQTFKNLSEQFSSKASLIEANQALGEELASKNQTLNSLRVAVDERDLLLQIYGRSATSTGIAATVLVHPPQTPYDTIVVDAGSKEGVTSGRWVRLPQGGLIGRVGDVALHESKIELSTSNGVKTNAFLERGNVPVALVGAGGSTFRADLPKDILAMVGDRVLEAGIKGELVGIVREVNTSPSDSAEHLLIQSISNASALRFVLISSE
jgi:cell shape-determining protein MreC